MRSSPESMPKDTTPPAAPEPLPVPVIDNHCHLDTAMEHGGPDVAQALRDSAAVGVPQIVQVGCDLEGARFARDLAEQYESIIAAVALHPNEAPRHADGRREQSLNQALAEIEAIAASSDRVRAIGETGLDFFRTPESGRAAQHESFRAHIDLAKRLNKTLVIHDRDAHQSVLTEIDAEGAPERIVMHCFSGDAEFAQACLDRGAYLSFAGTVTFKNAPELREALSVTPLDRILVETDAPFLTPEPFRGRRNASYLVPITVRFMADFLGADLADFCGQIRQNTYDAFGGAW